MHYAVKKCLPLLVLALIPSLSFAQWLDDFKAHTAYLASDALKGRGTGSAEIKLAAAYIAEQFRQIGLQPQADGSYYQWFHVPDYTEKEANVIGIIPAAQPTDRSMVFTAHYDALGTSESGGEEDGIYNGARDNAVGVAALMELARQFMEGEGPRQHLVFIATAAEEIGTHGSRFYVENPVFPRDEITLCINIDGFNISGPRADYFVMPRQGVDFLDEIQSVAATLGWVYNPPDWIDGMNTNFDTASFLAKGIPAFTLWTGAQLIGGGQAEPIPFGRIHSPEDEINEHWNWEGVEAHLRLYKRIADYFLERPNGITVTDPQLFVHE
ncbi:M20/M25/M40 family metallo-hydrolase [Flavobacteriaceae bacterium 3-367]